MQGLSGGGSRDGCGECMCEMHVWNTYAKCMIESGIEISACTTTCSCCTHLGVHTRPKRAHALHPPPASLVHIDQRLDGALIAKATHACLPHFKGHAQRGCLKALQSGANDQVTPVARTLHCCGYKCSAVRCGCNHQRLFNGCCLTLRKIAVDG